MRCFALHAVSAGQIVPWALWLTSAGVLAAPEHGGSLTEAPQRHREHNLCRRAGPRRFARSPTRERRWPAGNSEPQGPTPAAGRPSRRRTPSNSLGCRAQRASRPAAPAAPYIAVHSARRRHISAGRHISAADDDVSPRARMEIRAPQCLPSWSPSSQPRRSIIYCIPPRPEESAVIEQDSRNGKRVDIIFKTGRCSIHCRKTRIRLAPKPHARPPSPRAPAAAGPVAAPSAAHETASLGSRSLQKIESSSAAGAGGCRNGASYGVRDARQLETETRLRWLTSWLISSTVARADLHFSEVRGMVEGKAGVSKNGEQGRRSDGTAEDFPACLLCHISCCDCSTRHLLSVRLITVERPFQSSAFDLKHHRTSARLVLV